ncbi:MAG TPA: chalcone isomerase family protein [Burkholderiaceae bacterium]|nr:chalcone isomerase family protein [Burkholderiaceae bacterium]
MLPASGVTAQATLPAPVAAELPGARLQGQGTLRFLGLHIYDARLWTQEPVRPEAVERTTLALELQYARTLRGPLIAERSIQEMRRVGDFSAEQGQRWETVMARLFPDVRAGDRIFGLQRPGDGARFVFGDRVLGEVRDAEFARLFFGIWLSPRTSEPALRAALLGLS